jgi:D-alanine transaminase
MSLFYVNGHYVPRAHAMLPVEDRATQFGDSVYEVIALQEGGLIDAEPHFARLERSLAELSIPLPMPIAALKLICREVIRRNRRRDGGLYIQITRGVAPRLHAFPADITPSVVVCVLNARWPSDAVVAKGVGARILPDIRWGRRDIKTTGLLPNVLGKQAALDSGAKEAIFVEPDGTVTEGSATNLFIITAEGELWTHPTDTHILCGVTRNVILALAKAQGIPVREQRFTREALMAAREVFVSGTVSRLTPIVRLDDTPVGNGLPGEITLSLWRALTAHCEAQVA